jgi:hypothetical protein
MAATASFTGPNGQDARAAMEWGVRTATTPTTGDLLYSGQVFRSRIRERTFRGVDAQGVPFTAYSTKGPYYFYPNREVGDTGRRAGTRNHTQAQVRAARATAAAGRFKKTGGGTRTPFGIKYASYAAAKAAHGVANVNLYGMEQHTHMLDTMLVKVGGVEVGLAADALMDSSEMAAFEQNQPATELALGFYGPEAARAKGQNEGNSRTPKREFFALSDQDLMIGEQAIVERMSMRAVHGR